MPALPLLPSSIPPPTPCTFPAPLAWGDIKCSLGSSFSSSYLYLCDLSKNITALNSILVVALVLCLGLTRKTCMSPSTYHVPLQSTNFSLASPLKMWLDLTLSYLWDLMALTKGAWLHRLLVGMNSAMCHCGAPRAAADMSGLERLQGGDVAGGYAPMKSIN